jgi:hypothetical protein
MSLFGSLRTAGSLPVENHLPGFDGATGWLISPPLAAADLQGKVVFADFWTHTCLQKPSASVPLSEVSTQEAIGVPCGSQRSARVSRQESMPTLGICRV